MIVSTMIQLMRRDHLMTTNTVLTRMIVSTMIQLMRRDHLMTTNTVLTRMTVYYAPTDEMRSSDDH